MWPTSLFYLHVWAHTLLRHAISLYLKLDGCCCLFDLCCVNNFVKFITVNCSFCGVELFMIISPAIFFIVTISDIMHFISKQPSDTYKRTIQNANEKSWGPVLLTSLTTTFSFFSFYFIKIQPLKNFGLITGLGVLIALWISMLCYALLIDRNVRIIHPNFIASNLLNDVTGLLSNYKQRIIWIILILVCISVSVSPSLKIDNYLLDELNDSSEFIKAVIYWSTIWWFETIVDRNWFGSEEVKLMHFKLFKKKCGRFS